MHALGVFETGSGVKTNIDRPGAQITTVVRVCEIVAIKLSARLEIKVTLVAHNYPIISSSLSGRFKIVHFFTINIGNSHIPMQCNN